jgi:uncharacterized membrane protein
LQEAAQDARLQARSRAVIYPLAVFSRHKPAGEWLYPLVGTLAFFLISAIAVYVLTSVWREKTAVASEPEPEAAKPAHDGLSAGEILDRRLATGEITIADYDQLVAALARRQAGTAAAAPVVAAATGAVRAVA